MCDFFFFLNKYSGLISWIALFFTCTVLDLEMVFGQNICFCKCVHFCQYILPALFMMSVLLFFLFNP